MPKITRVSRKKKETFVDVLKQDHRNVEKLFEEFEEAETGKRKLRIAHAILTELKVHTQSEEEVVYPALREAGVEEDMMNEADEEHHAAKSVMKEIENYGALDGHFDAKVTVLQEMIEHHVEEEEKEMFKNAKKVDDIDGVTRRLLSRKKELQHQYALKKAA